MVRQWHNVKPIDKLDIFSGLEDNQQSSMLKSFREFITTHNAGRLKPAPYVWLRSHHRGFVFYEILDFNCINDNISNELRDKITKLLSSFYVPFATTKDRNGIFVIADSGVYVYDVDGSEIILISSNFDSFCHKYLSVVDTDD